MEKEKRVDTPRKMGKVYKNKQHKTGFPRAVLQSSPTRGMWIEIRKRFRNDSETGVLPPTLEIGLNCKISRTVCCEFWKIPVADTRRAIFRACRYRMVCIEPKTTAVRRGYNGRFSHFP